jgi:FkbM family methyltransferase
MKIFDIGMYDGSDTAYYLECGYKVIAVEANPEFVDRAKRRFAGKIASGQLTCINAAISSTGEDVELNLAWDTPASNSLFNNRITNQRPTCAITVPGVTLHQLVEQFGMPDYLKVDIEGADHLCILSLTSETHPNFLSFEVGDDVDQLLSHVETIGFRRFKVINQSSFRNLANQRCLHDRLAHRLMRYMGYHEPLMVRRAGRFFSTGRSSGPVPWRSDGPWRSGDATRSELYKARTSNTLSGAYDIHATIG